MKKLYLLLLGLFFHTSLIADYSYDENGNIASVFIPGNGAVCYEYDPIQRLIAARYPNGNHFSYTYDFNSNLRAIQGPEGVTTYTYDNLNRLEEAEFPDGTRIAYRYDLMGRVTHLTYPDGEMVEYQYDDRGRLTTLKDSTGQTLYEYDDLTNLVVKETFPNGTTTHYVYDATPQILEVCHQDPKGNLISRFSYKYSKTGQITLCKEETSLSTKTTHYTY